MNKEVQNWRAYLAGAGEQPVLNRIWQSLKTGRPAEDTEFISKLEGTVGRRLEALSRGRPRKSERQKPAQTTSGNLSKE
jgi:hypothetical protein